MCFIKSCTTQCSACAWFHAFADSTERYIWRQMIPNFFIKFTSVHRHQTLFCLEICILKKYNSTSCNQTISIESIHMLHNQEFTVVIYKSEVCLIIQPKFVCTYNFSWLVCCSMWYQLVAWLCSLKFKTCQTFSNDTFINVIDVDPVYILYSLHYVPVADW